MEIIHLILGKANPNRMNGVNKVVFQLASKQAQSGRRVAVWGITKSPVHDYGERPFATVLFQAYRNPFRIGKDLKAALLRKGKQIVVHLHSGWVPVYASLAVFLKKHQIPYVLTPHGAYNTIAMKRSFWMKKTYFKLFEQTLIKNARQIHSIGQSEADGLNSIYPDQPSFLLPYGFTPQRMQRTHYPCNNKFTIGFLGRLDIYTKGLDLLLAAFDAFQSQEPAAQLWIIGDSSESEQLAQMVQQRNLQKKVWMPGSKFGREKQQLIEQMDIFAHPSRNEGLPSAVLETASAGVPSVVSLATNVGSYIEEYQAGIAVKNEDVTALTNAFVTLAEEWKAGRLSTRGENAQQMVYTAFDWEHMVGAFDRLYQPPSKNHELQLNE